MKKFIAMLLALVMVLSLAACGASGSDATEPKNENETQGEQTATTIKVAAIETAYESCAYFYKSCVQDKFSVSLKLHMLILCSSYMVVQFMIYTPSPWRFSVGF